MNTILNSFDLKAILFLSLFANICKSTAEESPRKAIEGVNTDIFDDSVCTALHPDDQECRMRCVMITNKLIDATGRLRVNGVRVFFPNIKNYDIAQLIHYCYTLKGSACKEAISILECLYRAHSVKVLRRPSNTLTNYTLPNPTLIDYD